MDFRVVIIGGGIGGLTAAIRLARQGCRVTVLESRDAAGGLASGLSAEGFAFDGGPYVLLDRPGLQWALGRLGIDADIELGLRRISHVYEVGFDSGPPISIHDSLEQTAAAFESRWPGSAARYERFIRSTAAIYGRLQPMQWRSSPGVADVVRAGALRDLPFLIRSLDSVLKSSGLPEPILQTLGIWTHVAGQQPREAPSPLALVPAAIHRIGAYCPAGGIAMIPRLLARVATEVGVSFRFGEAAHRIRCRNGIVTGVETGDETLQAEAVVSNVGLATYLDLLDEDGQRAVGNRRRRSLAALPLQSPGVCAYLAVRGRPPGPYLRFRLRPEPDGCRLLVLPGVLDPSLERDGWFPARLIAPMKHARAESEGEAGHRGFVEKVVEKERWWRELFDDVRILGVRSPADWGRQFKLHRNSMNPVMTSRFMLTGRLAHRSPWIGHLYVVGSATHPGQWVSFSAVSGNLAADRVLADRGVDR